jgi:hypothetical protein
MATYFLDLNNDNYTSEVLSYYLWGQSKAPSPSEITDEKWIDRTEKITLKIDPNQFLDKCGHLFNAKDFKLAEVFFSGKTALGNDLNINADGYSVDSNGNYILTHKQFVELFYGELKNK